MRTCFYLNVFDKWLTVDKMTRAWTWFLFKWDINMLTFNKVAIIQHYCDHMVVGFISVNVIRAHHCHICDLWEQCRIYHCAWVCLSTSPVCQGVAGIIFLPKCFFTMDFCLCSLILILKAFCFRAIPDIMIELIVYGSVPHSGPM